MLSVTVNALCTLLHPLLLVIFSFLWYFLVLECAFHVFVFFVFFVLKWFFLYFVILILVLFGPLWYFLSSLLFFGGIVCVCCSTFACTVQ